MRRLQALIEALQASSPAEPPPTDSELAHRWIFAAAGEALLIVDATSRSIVEANLAAADLLDRSRPGLIGQAFVRGLDRASVSRAQQLLERVASGDCRDSVTLRAFDGGREVEMTASYFSTAGSSYFLVRLAARGEVPSTGAAAISGAPTLELIQGARVAIVLTDLMLSVEFANRSFYDLVRLAPEEDLTGQSLTRWLDLSAQDLACIAAQGTARQASLSIDTVVRPLNQATRPVTACVVVVPDGEVPCCAFLIDDEPANRTAQSVTRQ